MLFSNSSLPVSPLMSKLSKSSLRWQTPIKRKSILESKLNLKTNLGSYLDHIWQCCTEVKSCPSAHSDNLDSWCSYSFGKLLSHFAHKRKRSKRQTCEENNLIWRSFNPYEFYICGNRLDEYKLGYSTYPAAHPPAAWPDLSRHSVEL